MEVGEGVSVDLDQEGQLLGSFNPKLLRPFWGTCAAAQGEAGRVWEIEAEIDALAAELWGLSEQELHEIQESLKELG